ncbi:hypothetical protein XELAEV_18004564mg [Xenopus laevis]|uniref:SRCR domain-containing protein n=1 Tax=Xenopus laevis TaxID=8355 RepID=A0A974GZS5_XENLA|nr:hypothetical protein XELAEV_18004564mg [Xenopus laevis]
MDSDWTHLRLWSLYCMTVYFIASSGGAGELNFSHLQCAGFLQLCTNGSCLQFCGEQWNEESSRVACAQLNCGTLLSLTNLSDSRDRQRQLDTQGYRCHGNESSIDQCPRWEEKENCTGDLVFLVCTGLGEAQSAENTRAEIKGDKEETDTDLSSASPTCPTGTSADVLLHGGSVQWETCSTYNYCSRITAGVRELPCNSEPCSRGALPVLVLSLLLGLSLFLLLTLLCGPPILHKIRRRVSKKKESQWIGPAGARHNGNCPITAQDYFSLVIYSNQSADFTQSPEHQTQPNDYSETPHTNLHSAYPALERLLRVSVPDDLSESEYDFRSLCPL